MAGSWYISREKVGIAKEPLNRRITLNEWQNVVDNDEELIWFEDTKHGRELFKDENVFKKDKIDRVQAHYDINPKYGHGNVQLKYREHIGFVSIMHTKVTLTRIEKYHKIAKKLSAKLFRNKTEIDERQIEIIRQRYKASKFGIRAPEDEL